MKQLLIIPLIILLAAKCEDKPYPDPTQVTCDSLYPCSTAQRDSLQALLIDSRVQFANLTARYYVSQDSLFLISTELVNVKDQLEECLLQECPECPPPVVCPPVRPCPCDTTCPEPPEPPQGTLLFRSTFENGLTPETGHYSDDLRNGGTLTVVNNPSGQGRVLRAYAPAHTSGERQRAEYQTQRFPIINKTYTYKWDAYFPVGTFRGVTYSSTPGAMCSQFKTYPCGEGTDPNNICESGGIFNDLHIGETAWIRLRAYPDCEHIEWNYTEGRWNSYKLEIYYTTGQGYAKFWINDVLVQEFHGKTLYDSYSESCGGMFWANGLYCSFTGKSDITYYLDNIELYEN